MTEPDSDDDADGVSRRWLIRLLVALGVGIPVAVEGATFLGLVTSRLAGDGDDTTTESPTRRPATGVGDELLPGTPPAEILRDAAVRIAPDAWRFTVTVHVENTSDAPYTFRVESVTTGDGTRVTETVSTGRIPPGDARTLTHAWRLPVGETPATMTVTGVTHENGDREVTERRVRLATIPVSG